MTNSDEPRPLPAAQIAARRERTVERLCEYYAADHLNDAELQERIDLAYAATSVVVLDGLLADLPALDAVAPAPDLHGLGRAAPGEVRDRQIVVAIMGGAERKGAWTPPRQLFAFAVMGGVVLDFREARFAGGVTEVNIFALMGGVEILVPPGVRLENNGIAIMGGWEQPGGAAAALPADAPTLRLTGLALMGGVDISMRLAGESAKEARARRRLERGEARQLRRGG